MMKNFILLICTIFLVSLSAYGQNRQDVIDDGFTWFEAVGGEALGQNNIPYSTGWYLKSFVKVFGVYPNRSAIKLVISKAGKAVATTRCETGIYQNTGNAVDYSYMMTADCWRKDTATKETGLFDVQVFTVNGNTDEEKLVRTYKIEVRTVNRIRAGQQPGDAPPQYYINRHAESAASWMFLRPSGYVSYFAYGDRPERSGANHVEFFFSLSPSEVGKNLPHGYFRCSVNGQRLSLPGPMPYADQAIGNVERQYQVIYQDRIAPRFQRGTEYRDEIGFRMIRVKAPLTWGKARETNRLALEDHPGKWECSWMNNGEVWRTWRFTVGTNGLPETHAEQRGNINLNFNSFLVEMEIPAGGSALDERLNGPTNTLFYGLTWSTADGRVLAGRVPKKGNPFPVPSNSPNAMK